jgi:hypothetical protein
MWAGILWLPTIACFWVHALALKISMLYSVT